MGRRPNPLILEYFERGDKLEDSSNRYNHTCKACGENFPKGRIDSLVAHLTKKCASLSLADRTKIVFRLHDLGDGEDTAPIGHGTTFDPARTVDLPYSPSRPQNFNGLNVLAEASRRVGATEQRQLPGYTSAATLQQAPTLPVDPNLDSDPFANVYLSSHDESLAPRSNSFSMPGATGSALSSAFSYVPIASQNALPDLSTSTDTAMSHQPADLSSIAASANETLTHVAMPMDSDIDMTHDHDPNHDHDHDHDHDPTALFDSLNAYHGLPVPSKSSMTWPALTQAPSLALAQLGQSSVDARAPSPHRRATHMHRRIAISPDMQPTNFVSESGIRVTQHKPRIRQRFSEDRRIEVQQMRQLGACLRCHIIRKPCSGGSPCTPCGQIENARVWKLGCIRTRPGTIFSLYSVNLHSTFAMVELKQIKETVDLAPLPGQIEVSLVGVGSTTTVLAGLLGRPRTSSTTTTSSASTTSTTANDIFLLDGDSENLASAMEHYLDEIASALRTQEDSPILRPALALAAKLSVEKKDDLLGEVLSLWTATQVLVSTGLTWRMEVQPHSSSTSPPIILHETDETHSYFLITLQLRAVVEKRANVVSTSIMKQIQKRVLKSKPHPTFQTFLLAVILLNCVERYCWLFRTWTAAPYNGKWPLGTSAEVYAEQGHRFADIMHFMVNLRSLAPPTIVGADDGLLSAKDVNDADATAWFHEMKISPAYLDQLQSGQLDADNPRSLDGTFFAALFRPYSG